MHYLNKPKSDLSDDRNGGTVNSVLSVSGTFLIQYLCTMLVWLPSRRMLLSLRSLRPSKVLWNACLDYSWVYNKITFSINKHVQSQLEKYLYKNDVTVQNLKRERIKEKNERFDRLLMYGNRTPLRRGIDTDAPPICSITTRHHKGLPTSVDISFLDMRCEIL